MDGQGYPAQMPGKDIPLDARIIAVADAYNAMTSVRPYRDAMPPARAMEILREHAGAQHEESIVEAFSAVLEQRDSDYATARGAEFTVSRAVAELLQGHIHHAPNPAQPRSWRSAA
jgi:HD-GYP domain-containing protein (c-di-GMP phosphodiesterase class II)